MFRCSSYSRAFAVALIFVALSAVEALAHCFVGARFLPATLATDDPCVADEMSLADRVLVEDRRHAAGNGVGHLGGLCQTHHRGFRNFDRRDMVANPPAGRLHRGRVSETSKLPRSISCSKTVRTNWRCCWA